MGCFPDVEINIAVSTLRIGYLTPRPKINLKITLKQRYVPAGLSKIQRHIMNISHVQCCNTEISNIQRHNQNLLNDKEVRHWLAEVVFPRMYLRVSTPQTAFGGLFGRAS